ncbi:MAG: methyltransferase [Adhaeribacter sp.]|nr:methyltransferase [Adhaeribacter sp.]
MAQPDIGSTKPKTDIDCQKEIWEVANQLLGTEGVVKANGSMTAESTGEKNVQEYRIRHHMVDCIVQMPDKLFLTTEHRQRQQEVLFIDARKLGQMASRRLRVFHDEDIAKVADTYHQWRNLHGSYTDIDGLCKAATLPEIEANNFVLSPCRYVGSEALETDGVPFEEKMQR